MEDSTSRGADREDMVYFNKEEGEGRRVNREDTWQKLIELAVVTGNNPAGLWHLSGADLKE